jgi:hypothetical protein
MKLKMVSNNCFVNPECIQAIVVTGDYSYAIFLDGGKSKIDCHLNNKDILAVDYIKDELIPLLMDKVSL